MADFNYAQVNIFTPEQRRAVDAIVAELNKIRTAHAALLTKLDGDATIDAADWTSSCSVAANELKP